MYTFPSNFDDYDKNKFSSSKTTFFFNFTPLLGCHTEQSWYMLNEKVKVDTKTLRHAIFDFD